MLLRSQHATHQGDGLLPLFGFGGELLAARPGYRVVTRTAMRFGRAPLAGDQGALLQPQKGRVYGALVKRKHSRRGLLDAAREPETVQRSHDIQRFQHHDVERAVGNFGFWVVHVDRLQECYHGPVGSQQEDALARSAHFANSGGTGIVTLPVAAHSAPRRNVILNAGFSVSSGSWPNAVTKTR